jgi:hypothetical protein
MIPQDRKSDNLHRSFNKFFYTNFSVPHSMQTATNFQDEFFDASTLEAWVDVIFLEELAGKKGIDIVQIDVYTRARGKKPSGDRYKVSCQVLADKVHEALHVDAIPIYDFSSTPITPSLMQYKKMIVANSNGKFREPDGMTSVMSEEGINRITFTYWLRTIGDFSKSNNLD